MTIYATNIIFTLLKQITEGSHRNFTTVLQEAANPFNAIS